MSSKSWLRRAPRRAVFGGLFKPPLVYLTPLDLVVVIALSFVSSDAATLALLTGICLLPWESNRRELQRRTDPQNPPKQAARD